MFFTKPDKILRQLRVTTEVQVHITGENILVAKTFGTEILPPLAAEAVTTCNRFGQFQLGIMKFMTTGEGTGRAKRGIGAETDLSITKSLAPRQDFGLPGQNTGHGNTVDALGQQHHPATFSINRQTLMCDLLQLVEKPTVLTESLNMQLRVTSRQVKAVQIHRQTVV